MAPATCPNGHPSESTDYCDICGTPMGTSGGGSAPAGPGAGSAAAGGSAVADASKPLGVVCPNCGVMNALEALFCEACGYDYTTGTMPRPAAPSVLDLDTPLPSESPADVPAGASESGPVSAGQAAGAPVSSAASPSTDPGDAVITESAPAAPPATASSAPLPTTASSASPPAVVPSVDSSSTSFDWVVEVWIDPEWFALQQSPDPLPSPGLPEIVPLRKTSLLVGRPSRSRNITPDIDCEPDSGTSRRQAQLTTDGSRWFVEDLGSANGTYVSDAAGPLPTRPIPVGRKHELDGDDRIYIGAWTRLVLRKATPEDALYG